MEYINYKINRNIPKDIEPLYVEAFPAEERPPEWLFFENALKEGNELLGFYDNNQFIGFTNLLFHNDLCYIFFLAVSPSQRNKGFGSQIIQEVFSLYPNKRFVLCYEEIDGKYEDIDLRIRRRDFYYRNGFINNNLKTCEYDVRYDTCYHGERPVSFEEYLGLMVHCYGSRAKKFIKKAS